MQTNFEFSYILKYLQAKGFWVRIENNILLEGFTLKKSILRDYGSILEMSRVFERFIENINNIETTPSQVNKRGRAFF
ncbi:hypothetical protein SBF1_5540003 [Candidatus Desulfosporosinus infrequens]|uniref:Uncharacterized protein n=1 Tax=Candidatus Desulfosporosinus infrequens TaxID=2043169 RepID=A0A2U3LJA9_9FIRM|nr:hypothetical protein SBF1_5540003 [Candidatus Desulfosporosinus infrequens]